MRPWIPRQSPPTEVAVSKLVRQVETDADQLRQNERAMRLAMACARLTWVEVDFAGGTRTAENFASVMGYTPPGQEADASVGTRLLLAHVVVQDRERVTAAYRERVGVQPSGRLEYRVLGDDRVERRIETRWSVELGPDGLPLRSLTTHLDISECKRVEPESSALSERYRHLFNAMDEGFCLIEVIFDDHERAVDWRYLEVNPAFEKHSGLHDVAGKLISELIPGMESKCFEVYGEVASTGEGIRFVNEVKRLQRWFDMYVFRIGGAESRQIATVFTDITARKQADEALRRAEQRQRFIMDSMPQKIVTATPDGTNDYFNPQWSEFTGLSFQQIKGWGWKQFIHPDDIAMTTRIWQASLASGEASQSEQRYRRADGQYRWHVSRSVPVLDAQGNIVQWIGSSTDIHESKEADQRKDEFLAMLAHELRNPLAPMRTMLEVMARASGRDELIKPALDIMERQLKQMTRLIDDLLDVSRISQGKIHLQQEKVELATVIRQVVEAASPSCEAAEQELTVTLPARSVYLLADPVRLVQVFGNLLNNAVKFSRAGGRISLTAERQDGDVVVTIEDTGIGISSHMLPRIFQLFAQGDQTLERSHSGLGIGLSLVRRMVEMHGGSVAAASRGVDQGSQFIVRLPLLVEQPGVPPGRMPDQALTDRRILVVDDNEDAANTLAMLLS